MNVENINTDLYKVIRKLLWEEPFYGIFLSSLNKVITSSISTAAVSKRDFSTELMINPDYWMKQDEKTRIGILKHELLHICFFHILMSEEYKNDRYLHNIAADLEVNQFIQDDYKGDTWQG